MDSFGTGSQQYFDQNAYGDSILADQNKKKRKKIIITALILAAVGAAIAAAVFVFLNQTTSSSAKPSQASKDYATYFIFGPDSNNITDYRLLTEDEFYFYTTGRYDQAYLDSVSSKLADLLNKASNEGQKSAIRTQQELLKFYEIAKIFLDDYTANYEIAQPEIDNLSKPYRALNTYIGNEKKLEEARLAYDNEDISKQEYDDLVSAVNISSSALQKQRRIVYEEMAQYAKEIYEQ